MRFWRRFADVNGKIVLAVDKSSIRLPKTDCKCQESTTKCHVLLFYFRFLYCFYFVSPHWETDQKQLTFIKQIFCFWTRAELQNEMHLKNDAQFYFITFLFLFFSCRGNWLKWIFLALVKIQVDYKLTNYAHKFLDIFIAIKVAFSLLLFLPLLLLVCFSFQKLNCFEWPIYCRGFFLFVCLGSAALDVEIL